MDAACGSDNWEPVLALDGAGEVEAALLCCFHRKWGVRMIIPAPLSPFSGIWFRPVHQPFKNYAETQRILDLTEQLISKLPLVAVFIQQYHFSFQNWLSYKWNGFRQTTRYTYFLSDLSNLDEVYQAFKGSTRTAIKKAENSLIASCSDEADILYEMVCSELSVKGVKLPLKKSDFLKLDAVLQEQNSRKIYFAADEKGNRHAAVCVVWDTTTTYLLLTAVDRSFQNSTALSFLIWRAIQDASERGHSFDFEGSSLKKIEPFFRSFGGEAKPYYRITKAKNKMWDLLLHLSGKGI